MHLDDIEKFSEAWVAAHELCGSTPSDAALAMAFRLLERFETNDVIGGITAHLSDPDAGRFAPKPADIIKQITDRQNRDGRPESDEAWAIALKSFDEHTTVVMNNEIGAALAMSRDIYQDGDKVGARMAFKAGYEREVREARERGEAPHWFPSFGFDPHGREQPLMQAVQKGWLSSSHAASLLPPPMTQDGVRLMDNLTKDIKRLK